jgi:hypothetical protein
MPLMTGLLLEHFLEPAHDEIGGALQELLLEFTLHHGNEERINLMLVILMFFKNFVIIFLSLIRLIRDRIVKNIFPALMPKNDS